MHHCVHAEGCSPRRCLGTTFCAARRGGQGCFNAVSEFSSTEFFPRFLTRGKNSVCPEKKNGTDPGKNSVAGAGPLGRSWRAGMAGRAGMGLGPGWAGGGRGDVRVST